MRIVKAIVLMGFLVLPAQAKVREPKAEKIVACQGSDGRVVGTVGFFNEAKGYGFIKPDAGGGEAFVHITQVERSGLKTLKVGDRLIYKHGNGRDRTDARDLVRCQ